MNVKVRPRISTGVSRCTIAVTAVLLLVMTGAHGDRSVPRGMLFVRNNHIWLRVPKSGLLRVVCKCGALPIWLGSGDKIGFARYGNVYIENLFSGSTIKLTKFAKGKHVDSDVRSLSWDPIGHAIVFSRDSGFSGHLIGDNAVHQYLTTSIYWVPISTNHVYMAIPPWEQGAVFAFSSQLGASFSPDGSLMTFIRNGDIWLAARGDRRPINGWNGWEWDISRIAAVASFDDPNWHGSRDNEGAIAATISPDHKSIAYVVSRLGGSGFSRLYISKFIRDSDGDITGIGQTSVCPEVTNACSVSWDIQNSRYLFYGTNIDGTDIYRYDRASKHSHLLIHDGSYPSS